jgi:cAMP-dependent protein kinase regulator
MNFVVPEGLTDLLQGFTVAVLRERPPDLVDFAVNYFSNLKDSRQPKGVKFSRDSDDEEEVDAAAAEKYSRRKSVSGEHYDPEEDMEEGEEPKIMHPKSDEQRQRLNEAVKNILLFRALDPEQMQDILDGMFERKVEPGEQIIHQGDDGDNFYVIDSGQYDIFVEVNGVDKKVGQYENRGFFGELALMYNMPRAATIVAVTPGIVWALDRTTFRRIVMKQAYVKRQMYLQFINYVPMLKTCNEYEKMNIADALYSQTFQDGEKIINQGDSADCMYFVEEGEVRIAVRKEGAKDEIELTRCGKGAYFGELALITRKPRAASAFSVGTSKCAVLDVTAFERLLGPCMEVMKRNIAHYEEQMKELLGDDE